MTDTKINNIFGTTFSGELGKKIVAGSWKGHEYIRPYKKPPYTRTEDQLKQRGLFANAVKAWQALSGSQQEFYDSIAERMSGYNLFISRHIEAERNGEEPEVPIVMRWTTEDGQPVINGKLIILQGDRQIFSATLKRAEAEAALTTSDAPYTFVLKRGVESDIVLKTKDPLGRNVPSVIESASLGIKLVMKFSSSRAWSLPGLPQ